MPKAERLSVKTYEEYFRDKVTRLTSEKGVFMAKCDWPQYAPLYASGIHATYMQNAVFFYLTRSDVLAQAISRYIATTVNYFHSPEGKTDALKEDVPFSYDGIFEHLNHLVRMQSDWERFFACEGILAHRIAYEEIDADPAAVIRRVATALGMSLDNVKVDTDYKVVRTEQNERLRDAFVTEHRQRVASADWGIQLSKP